MASATLSELWIYPVKSLRGIALTSAVLDPRGLQFDRHWMVVDPEGSFLTQRQIARMSLIDTYLSEHSLILKAPGQEALHVPLNCNAGEMQVTVWRDRCRSLRCGEQADRWLSHFLQRPCHLVRFPDNAIRRVDPRYAEPQDQTGFSDGYPMLLLSEGSLADLNQRLDQPLAMRRFRPNLVVSGVAPYAEDRWRRICIDGIEMRIVKPCARCVIPTIDPETGERASEPLKTLSTYRRQNNEVLFGQNVIHNARGTLTLGSTVEILEVSDVGLFGHG